MPDRWTEEEHYHEMEEEAEHIKGTCEACPHALTADPVFMLCLKDHRYTRKDSTHKCKWRNDR